MLFRSFIAIENGERQAKSDELVRLAGFLGRQVSELVRPTEPVIDLRLLLRAVAERTRGADEVALGSAIDELQRLAEDYRDLERMTGAPLRFNYPPEISLNPRIDPAELGEGVAIQERRRMGLGDQPVIHLRSMLEWDVGLRIFYGDLPSAIAGMHAYTAELGGCILVNRQHPPERRRVSMLHAYGHLLVDRVRPGIDDLAMSGRKPANEQFADAFGLCFLMPATSIRQRFHDTVNSTGDFHVADLRRLSHFYFVSVEAMALRLEQLGLISKGKGQFLKASKFAPLPATARLGRPPQPANDYPFPDRYRYLAVQAYERGDLGDSDLASFLRCDVATAREIVAQTLTTREIESAGEECDRQWDFPKSLLTEVS